MPTDNKATNKEEIIQYPDYYELWKKIYYKTEEACAISSKEFITSNMFVKMLDQIREQYLCNHKLTTQGFDKYFEMNPFASKKDVARVAELVIALEDKLDNFDMQFSDNMNSIANSLIKLVDFQQTKYDTLFMKQDILGDKLGMLANTLQNLQRELNYIKINQINKDANKSGNIPVDETIDERHDLDD